MQNRVLLCIMDGWGISTGAEKYDATKLSHPVNVPELIKDYPSINIHADGEFVGLPHGQMGTNMDYLASCSPPIRRNSFRLSSGG